MLTGLKVSSLVFKCVFYRAEHNAKVGRHGAKFWRLWNPKMKYNGQCSMSRQKNGIICLVIMFTPGVMVMKVSKLAHFLYFFADDTKKLVTV